MDVDDEELDANDVEETAYKEDASDDAVEEEDESVGYSDISDPKPSTKSSRGGRGSGRGRGRAAPVSREPKAGKGKVSTAKSIKSSDVDWDKNKSASRLTSSNNRDNDGDDNFNMSGRTQPASSFVSQLNLSSDGTSKKRQLPSSFSQVGKKSIVNTQKLNSGWDD